VSYEEQDALLREFVAYRVGRSVIECCQELFDYRTEEEIMGFSAIVVDVTAAAKLMAIVKMGAPLNIEEEQRAAEILLFGAWLMRQRTLERVAK
jgi:hypothetical protein